MLMSFRREAFAAPRARKVGAPNSVSGCCCSAASRARCAVVPSTSAATTAPAGRRTANRRTVARRASPSQREDVVIENLTEDYCDDFVCQSSPAVEQSVRQLANNISQVVWGARQFAPKVEYSDDATRRFKGNDKYERLTFPREYFDKCRVSVDAMEMVDLDTARIEWSLAGETSLGTVDLSCVSTFEMNVITGKVEKHMDEWKASNALAPASLLFLASRLRWSVAENIKDKVEEAREAAARQEEEKDDSNYFVDPMDPKKYIQQQDTAFDDAIQYGIVLALLYACVQVLRTLEGVI